MKSRTIPALMKKYNVKYSPKPNKTYVVNVKGKTIHFGDPNLKIKHNIPKYQKAYCARAEGITNKKGEKTYKNKMSPNYWSHKFWFC